MSKEYEFGKPIEENKMGVLPVNKLLVSMSLPIIISMLIQALYNIVDSAFVSMLNMDALNAVSLAFPMQNLTIAVSVGLGVGTNALLSRSLGEKNYKTVNKTVVNAMFLAVIAYAFFLIFGLFFAESFFKTQTNNPQIIKYGTDYLSVCMIYSFSIFGQILNERFLQATGKTIYSMISQGTGAIINIILDPILIFGLFGFPRMEVKGAAYATIIAQIIGMLVTVYFNLKVNKEIDFSLKGFKPDLKIIKRILVVGLPSMVMQAIFSVVVFFINRILISFTEVATAVFGAYYKLQSFAFMPIFGLTNGMIPIVSYNYGARNKERVSKTIKLSITYAVLIMFVCTLIFQLFPKQLLGIFNPNEEMLSIGVPALRTISSCFILAGFSIITSSVSQAFGNGIPSLVISITRQLVVLLPSLYFLSFTGNLNLVWLAYPISEIIAGILSAILLKHTYSKQINHI